MSGFAVRRLTQDDLPGVEAILRHHISASAVSFVHQPPSAEEVHAAFAEREAMGYPQLALFSVVGGDTSDPDATAPQQQLLGFAWAGTFRAAGKGGYRYTAEDSIYIAPGHERRGAGRTLLLALIQSCEAAGLRQLLAVISVAPGGDKLPNPSIALHTACGFREVAHLPSVGQKHGAWWDAKMLQLELNGGGSRPADEASLPPGLRSLHAGAGPLRQHL